MTAFTESVVEEAALEWFAVLGYVVAHGPEIAPGEVGAERDDFGQVVLHRRLRDALRRLNPDLPVEAIMDAFRRLTLIDGPSIVTRNHALHRMLVDGVNVEYRRPDGSIGGAQARVLDFDDPANNDWLVVNQFTVIENKHNRRPDVVVFVNGLPLAILELKNAADEDATIWSAFQQLETYRAEIPSLFTYNATQVISDGTLARLGTVTAGREWFMPWRTIEGQAVADNALPQLQVVIQGVFERRRFLELVRYFIVFEDMGAGTLVKKMAGYHQFHAVNVALEETLRASTFTPTPEPEPPRRRTSDGSSGTYRAVPQTGGEPSDRRIGVVWHTQGAGKSLTMAFYAGRVILEPSMQNPTVVVITDRNDLDDQLFGTFARCHDLLRQKPRQAESREELRELLRVNAGGVIFTTIQKFMPDERGDTHPVLSPRQNIVVIADEAHRSQYEFEARLTARGDLSAGFARHMRDALPHASYIGFTGTPLELEDKNTQAVFGDYISIYDIERAVVDEATVPIYYESRLAKLGLEEERLPHLDSEFDEATEGEELDQKERLKTKWAQLEAIVGAEERVNLIARDLVEHFETRLEVLDGKAMVVAMSRRIAMDLYDAIVKLRPDWHHDDDEHGAIKVVMTGNASEGARVAMHARNKPRREALAKRFRNPDDPLRIVIVRDMWLTGFDAPVLHTMYVDKPMQGHSLMQAIARVNRKFRDKPGGLIVDYIGLADDLRRALATYTNAGGSGSTALPQEDAINVLLRDYEICRDLFHGFDWSKWTTGTASERLSLIPAAQEHILALGSGKDGQKDGKERLLDAVASLSRSFALAATSDFAQEIATDVAFFKTIRAALAKGTTVNDRTQEETNAAIRQIVESAIAPDGVIDIFAAAGLQKPDISILSDDFLADVRNMPQRNLAVELLRKLLEGEVKARRRKNVVQSRSFADLLQDSIRRYQNRAIETAQVIEELIELAKRMNEAARRGEDLGPRCLRSNGYRKRSSCLIAMVTEHRRGQRGGGVVRGRRRPQL
ncbi:MAG: type I restriction endonuclease subunit R, partial [Dehalococcoidia bacterium]|nr:type I restriction endonuclease subunit R [Dehalococcoidia bacterium]